MERVQELQQSLNKIYDNFKESQFELVHQFDVQKLEYAESISALSEAKRNLELNRHRITQKKGLLVEGINKRIETCKQLQPQQIYTIEAYDKDNPLYEIFVWIFGVVYKIPTENLELKKTINLLMIEEGREFIIKLAAFNSKDLSEQELEATNILLEKQQEYLSQDIELTKKLQLMKLFNIILMIAHEKELTDDIEFNTKQMIQEQEKVKFYDQDEKCQSLKIQYMKEQQQNNKIFHHALSTISQGLKNLKL
ncbi:hypothetical protein TTHERM_00170230 (macronuclear) [Tetrahymena thermophila SB210]|uniref:Uncharacterized protein n=1 Tax=Tetrahymena thermophila (strain SB210) TaxID=312017 RepID=Q22TK0_TETTS|nr:hypothetical protein TTHERM_00170230 [Tetrahymena thermophila SB210]EAR88438.2 hypothetical protein TTHERM_00170230 [Tetrahymena thermophila SB210]|eukprot:XP_001008683.2 hypothetical protein TTHERM_00170230 [Tetrahymena thermophila SB210]